MARSAHTSSASMHDYEAESDHHTLTRAAEIQDDPKRMAGVRRHHTKQTKALGRMHALLHGQGRSPSKGGR